MKIFWAMVAMVAATMAVTPASAGWWSDDWYVSIGAGAIFPQDMDTKNLINPAASEEISFDTGWTVVGAVGDRSTRWIRSELEVGYRTVDADQLNDGTKAFGPFNMTGSAEIWNFGYNGYFDFDMEDSRFHPYLGAGAGVAHFDVDVNRNGAPTANQWDGDDTSFYYQGIAGAGFDFGPAHQVFLEYRFFGTLGLNAESNFGAFTPDSNEDEFQSHVIMGGIRISF